MKRKSASRKPRAMGERLLALDEDTVKDYLSLLMYVSEAEDVNTVANTREIFWQEDTGTEVLDTLLARETSSSKVVSTELFLQMLTQAAARSMTLAVKGTTAKPCWSCDNGNTERIFEPVVGSLCRDLRHVLLTVKGSQESRAKSSRECIELEDFYQLIVSDLLPALTGYTLRVIDALEQLAAEGQRLVDVQLQLQQQKHNKKQQQQLQQNCDDRKDFFQVHCVVGQHVDHMIGLWQAVSAKLQNQPVLLTDITPSMTAAAIISAIKLTTASQPLLKKGLQLTQGIDMTGFSSTISSSSSDRNSRSKGRTRSAGHPISTLGPCFYLLMRGLEVTAISTSEAIAGMIAAVVTAHGPAILQLPVYPLLERSDQKSASQQQRIEQLLEASEQLCSILETEDLPELLLTALASQAAALHAAQSCEQGNDHAPPTAVPETMGQQQQQQQSPAKPGWLLNSHWTLLKQLGFDAFSTNDLDLKLDADICHAAVWALDAVLNPRQGETAASLSSVSSIIKVRHQKQQHQRAQLDGGRGASRIPAHLILPTAKVLLEILLLLPVTEVSTRTIGIRLVLQLLLRLTAAQQPPTAATVDSPAVLPSAVAAGLLHPVIQLLPRVVLQSLQKSSTTDRQQSTALSLHHAGEAAAATAVAERRLLLSTFGDLLMLVLLSVEPKHIAAALRSDPVVPLVAIEANIRAQACHLSLSGSSRYGCQQQQSEPVAAAGIQHNSNPSTSSSEAADYAHLATLQLMRFVSRVVLAVNSLMKDPQASALPSSMPGRSGTTWQDPLSLCVTDTLIRIYGLISTSCMVVKGAAKAWQLRAAESMHSTTDVQSLAIDGVQQQCVPSKASPAAAAAAVLDDVKLSILDTTLSNAAAALCELASSVTDVFCLEPSSGLTLSPQHQNNACGNRQSGLQQSETSSTATNGSGTFSVSNTEALTRLLQNMLHRVVDTATECLLVFKQQQRAVMEKVILECHPGASADGLNGNFQQAMVAVAWSTLGYPLVLRVMKSTLAVAQRALLTQQPHKLQEHLQPMRLLREAFTQCCESDHELLDAVGAASDAATAVGFNSVDKSSVGQFASAKVSGAESAALAPSTVLDGAERLVGQHSTHSLHLVNLQEQLQEFAVSGLTNFPIPFCCNNPSCVTLFKLSEYQLVSGKACVCGGCKVARYCSRECQKKHWKQHKRVCCD